MHRRVVASMRRPISPFWMITQGLASTVMPEREPAHQMTLTFLCQDPLPSPQSSGVLRLALWEPQPSVGAPQAHQDTGALPGGRGDRLRERQDRKLGTAEQPVLVNTIESASGVLNKHQQTTMPKNTQPERPGENGTGDPSGAQGQGGLGVPVGREDVRAVRVWGIDQHRPAGLKAFRFGFECW